MGAVGGFLIKVVFVLPIAVFVLDFVIEKKVFNDRTRLIKYILWILGGVAALILIMLGIKFIFPFFNLEYSFKYWEHFFTLTRGWFQTIIQCIKAVLYTSPFLVLIPIFADKKILTKSSVILGILFYNLYVPSQLFESFLSNILVSVVIRNYSRFSGWIPF